MLHVSWLVVIAFCLSYVHSEICDTTDHDCVTKGANKSYGYFVNGIDDIVEASDPLRIDSFEDKKPNIHYKLTNASLTGMKDCVVSNLQIDKDALTFLYILKCPHIIVKTDYEVKGTVLITPIEGKGVLTATGDNYVLMFNCKYERTVGEDDKTYVQIKSHTFDVEATLVKFEMTNLFNGDKERANIIHKLFNRNWRIVHSLFRSPTVDKFMELFVQNLNRYLKAKPVEHVLPRESESQCV